MLNFLGDRITFFFQMNFLISNLNMGSYATTLTVAKVSVMQQSNATWWLQDTMEFCGS